ncbi:type II-A CRISPR-associated protein Csn2 [bacterium]|nr:type II-A CRISPR-associated protein Csn2 [bacterium]
MRCQLCGFESELWWDEERHLNELILENPQYYRQIIQDLYQESKQPQIMFNEAGQSLVIGSEVEVMINPMALNFNNRQVMLALIKNMNQQALAENNYLATCELKSEIVRYLNNLVDDLHYNFEISVDEVLLTTVFKAANLQIMADHDTLLEKLVDYMVVMNELVGTKLFVWINLGDYLLDDEKNGFCHEIAARQLDVLLIENEQKWSKWVKNNLIIDQDWCEI